MSKDHFYFSRNDRIVALVLLSVILIAVVARIPFSRVPPETTVQPDTVTVQTATPTSQPEPKREYTRSTARYSSSKYRKDSVQRRPARRDTVVRRDSITYPRYTRKQPPASPLDLNTADSTMLVTLPGIGPYYASRILSYRRKLGGYTSNSQILEIDGIPDSVVRWFVITDTARAVRISVNSATLSQLRSHPYINFYQARAIIEMRRERGNIKGPDQLSFMEEFTDQDLVRLEPYLDYR